MNYSRVHIMILLILASLCVTTLNCQLAFTWLNQQQFQCAQNIRNYREAIQHQYMCIVPRTRTCVVDANAHNYSSIYLDHFCGLIALRYFTQCEITWSIYVVPNIHINFLNFSLFELSSYWQCDFEYLRVATTNKNSTFCGSRLPWVYDASGSLVKMTFFTERFGVFQYHLHFQYYGAHVPNNQHFVLFMKPSGISDMHVPDIKQNEFEIFHFISGHRLDVVHLAAVNMCSAQRVVCYDGPGTKSPTIHCNQSTYQSSTFQMVCKFSRPNPGCLKGPRLIFQRMQQTIGDFRRIENLRNKLHVTGLPLDETADGTSKYIYTNDLKPSLTRKIVLQIKKVDISCPYMLYDKQSCMYGGAYIIDKSSSSDLYGDEVLSLCNPRIKFDINIPSLEFSILIIHYEHYSREKLNFKAYLSFTWHDQLVLQQNSMDVKGQTMSTNVTSAMFLKHWDVFVESYLLDLVKIQYFHIVLDVKPHAVHQVTFSVHQPNYSESCAYCKLSFANQSSNFMTRQYDTKTFNQTFEITERIESILINMTACDIFTFPVWSLEIWEHSPSKIWEGYNTTFFSILDSLSIIVSQYAEDPGLTGPMWLSLHIQRPEDVPPYAVWKVFLKVADGMSHVYMEVLTDNHMSSTVYEWDHQSSSVYEWLDLNFTYLYMTIDTGINFFFHYTDRNEIPYLTLIMHLNLIRQPLYDERLKISNKIPRLDNYTFYNMR